MLFKRLALVALSGAVLWPTLSQTAQACTRILYTADAGQVFTARSMDWSEDIGSNLWVFPRGMTRDGAAGATSVKWTSKYGSVIASGYDFATTDGVNEQGLAVNLLWLAESVYPTLDSQRPAVAVSVWAQYVLDNFASVAEAVAALKSEPFAVVTAKLPSQDRAANLHLAISDAGGDSAILEYVEGKLVVHHSPDYTVMTNSPVFDQQLAINTYWQTVGGDVMLPGTHRAADRFARAYFYTTNLPKYTDQQAATAGAMSVIRNASVPLGVTLPNQPNIASTLWRSVIDHKRQLYYFESAVSPNTFWVDLKRFDLSKNAPVKTLRLGKNQSQIYGGEVSAKFQKSKPFAFLTVDHQL
ncbi:MAG: linear amide C-N hydrolase [Thiomicrospira sp.]